MLGGLLLVFSLLVGLHAPTASPSGPSAARPAHGLSSLPMPARIAVSRALGADEHQFSISRAKRGSLTARSGVDASFGRRGVRVDNGALNLGLASIGRGHVLHPFGPAAPRIERSNMVRYNHAGVIEWYANGPAGVEQGFTLVRRPAGRGELRLAVGSVANGIRTHLAVRGGSLALVSRAGIKLLTYGGLTVTDAGGRSIPARIGLAGTRVVLLVDDAGARYPLRIDPLVEAAELRPSDAGGCLGNSVAISGNTVAAGVPCKTVNGADQGAVYVFTEPASGDWQDATQTAELTASDGAAGDQLGDSVAISDGTIVAGAPDVNVDKGAAYVFTEPSGGWANATQTAKLTQTDPPVTFYFAKSVAISGGTIVVGGYENAFVYTEPSSGWQNATQTAELTATGLPTTLDAFAASVAVWGNTIVVGDPEQLSQQGALYVYTEPTAGWQNATQTAELTASDGTSGNPGDQLGASVAMSDYTIVAGAPYRNSESGAVYVFSQPSTGWVNGTQTAELTDGRTSGVGYLGFSVAISGRVIVAAADSGPAAFEFDEQGSHWTDANTGSAMVASDVEVAEDYPSVGIDGKTIVVGAPQHAFGTSRTGAAYVFTDWDSTSTTVDCSPNPVTEGDQTTCTATVTDTTSSTGGLPVGTVSFTADPNAGSFGSAATCGLVPSEGDSQCSVTFTPEGSSSPPITADYTGDDGHSPSSGATTLMVNPVLQSTATTIACTPVTVGQTDPTSCPATVSDDTSQGLMNGPATGTVMFYDNPTMGSFSPASTCTPAQTGASTAACSVTFYPGALGAQTVTAAFEGDDAHRISSSQPFSLTVIRETSSALVCRTPTASQIKAVQAGKPVAIACTVTVTDISSGKVVTPKGKVTFSATPSGEKDEKFSPRSYCTLVAKRAGVASCAIAFDTGFYDNYKLTGAYAGDTVHAASGATAYVKFVPTTT